MRKNCPHLYARLRALGLLIWLLLMDGTACTRFNSLLDKSEPMQAKLLLPPMLSGTLRRACVPRAWRVPDYSAEQQRWVPNRYT